MARQGAIVKIGFHDEEYDAVKRAVREGTRVPTREGISVKSTQIETFVNQLVDEAIEDYREESPLEGVDVNGLKDLSDDENRQLAKHS